MTDTLAFGLVLLAAAASPLLLLLVDRRTPRVQSFDQHVDEALAVAALASETPTYARTLADFTAAGREVVR